jgi:DNA-binding GntR family transcriptional regulator
MADPTERDMMTDPTDELPPPVAGVHLFFSPLKRNERRPVYFQLAENVQLAIADGRLAHGDKLPAESRIAADLKVTQSTVRRAWAFLEKKGLVRREFGVGTFVS